MIFGFKKTLVLVSGILRNSEGKILLLQRSQHNKTYKGYWQFPEGKIKFGEKPEEAIKREIKEETNLDISKNRLMFVHSDIISSFGINFHLIRLVFRVEWKGKMKLSKEHSSYRWCFLKTVKNFSKVTRSVIEILPKFIK